jgi:hypothetical protein
VRSGCEQSQQGNPLFDHLIGAGEQRRQHFEAALTKFGLVDRDDPASRWPNGSPSCADRWLLPRDPETDRVFVRLEPNLPSGGQVAHTEIGAFLIAAGNGLEKQELLRLIGTLV